MRELVSNIYEAEGVIWNALMDILGADKTQTPPKVRRSWNVDGAPNWSEDDDIVFMQLTEEGAEDISQPIDSILEPKNEDLSLKEGLTRVLTLHLVAYGQNSYDNLLKIRKEILMGNKTVRQNKIYGIPAYDPIIRAPELYNSRWWERADTRIRFNCLMVFETDINRIVEADITVKANKSGTSETVYSDHFNVE